MNAAELAELAINQALNGHFYAHLSNGKTVDMEVPHDFHPHYETRVFRDCQIPDSNIRVATPHMSRWTPEEDARLIALREEGVIYEDIACRMNRSYGACRGRFETLGMAPIKPATRHWTEEEEAILIKMRRAGRKFNEIARIVGRSRQACRSRYEARAKQRYEALVRQAMVPA